MSTTPLLMTATPTSGPSPSTAFGLDFVIPMVLVFLIFWVLILRPQNKRMKAHQAAIAAVKKGDEVITGGGIRGRVTKVADDEAEVEIASGVKVRVVKSTLSQVVTSAKKPAND